MASRIASSRLDSDVRALLLSAATKEIDNADRYDVRRSPVPSRPLPRLLWSIGVAGIGPFGIQKRAATYRHEQGECSL
jgi:hypothetical protein